MGIFGWIALIVFALIGFAIVAYAVVEFMWVQICIFSMKIAKELEVLREDVKEKAELRRARLAKKREAQDKLANKKLDVKIEAKQDKQNEKLGGHKSEGAAQ